MIGRQLTLFRLFGIDVRVDASWLLIAVLISWSLATAYFPYVLPDQSGAVYWVMGIAGLIGLAFSIVAHEFAHSLVARRFAMSIRHITLFVFGGVAELEGEPPNAKAEFTVAIVGPLMSFAVAAAFFAVSTGAETLGATKPTLAVFAYLTTINIALGVFNLAPAFPLDGGRVLRAVLWRIKGSYIDATRIAATVGEVFAFLLMAFALANAFTGNLFVAIWFFLIGLFIRGAAIANLQQVLNRDVLAEERVSGFMRTSIFAVQPDMSVESVIDDFFYRHLFKNFPVVSGGRLIGVVELRDVQALSTDERARLTVGDVMRPPDGQEVIAASATAAEAIQRMQRLNRTRLYVVESGRLVGVVSLRDMLNLLDMRLRLDRRSRR
jgi:Zn-dependent protease/CBS domain-containing protein